MKQIVVIEEIPKPQHTEADLEDEVEEEGEGPAGEADCRCVERCEECENERESHEDQGGGN